MALSSNDATNSKSAASFYLVAIYDYLCHTSKGSGSEHMTSDLQIQGF